MTIGAAAGWKDLGDPGSFVRSLDASPEALIIGGGLLMIAALLRSGLSPHVK
jgi:hypothetical protein